MTHYQLYHEHARWYDYRRHAPRFREQQQRDREFVVGELLAGGPVANLLDVGCGTGVFLQYARSRGIDAVGLEPAPEMAAVARRRTTERSVRQERMQDLDEVAAYDAVVCLGWTLHYCSSPEELRQVLAAFFRALRPGGRCVLEIAHARHTDSEVYTYRDTGPDGREDDILFLYRFRPNPDEPAGLIGQYVFSCQSARTLFWEEHRLHGADAELVLQTLREVGFTDVAIYNSTRKDSFRDSCVPWVVCTKPARAPVIRPAAAADVAAVAEVHRTAWRLAYRGLALGSALEELSAEQREAIWSGTLAREARGMRLWVAERDGAVVGFVCSGPPDAPAPSGEVAEVCALYLLPEHKGTGLGRALMEHALADLRRRGFRRASLWVLASNEEARRFYERGGWQADGRARLFAHRGEPLPHLGYSLALVPPTPERR